jgi:uncharacterized protein YqcC (DUF446 family)
MQPDYAVVESKIDAIEAEMKRIGMWREVAPTPEQLQFKQAFGGDKLAFEQWLQFVFIARVGEIIRTGGDFPAQSQVSGRAYREWKMWGVTENVDALLEMLAAFDALFNA